MTLITLPERCSVSEQSAQFHNRIAADYDSLMEREPGNAWVRGAFRQLVCDTVAPGSLVLDFGCGTGLDTLWYALQGYLVLAYDNSPGMVAQLEQKGRAEMETGKVRAFTCPYDRLEEKLEAGPRPHAVVSNFAVLNHLPELHPFFEMLSYRTARPGWVILSVLNPLFWQEVVRPKWWGPCLQGVQAGRITCPGEEVTHYRHYISHIVKAAQPWFVKTEQAGVGTFLRYEAGPYDWKEPRTLAERTDRRLWKSFPARNLGKFTFLVFRRCV